MRKFFTFMFFYFSMHEWLLAAEKTVVDKSKNYEGISYATLGQTLLSLLAVLLLIIVLAWFAKRMNVAGLRTGKRIEVKENISLGNKERLVIVHVDGKDMLLGVTGHTINKLTDLELIKDKHASTENSNPSFLQALKKVTLKNNSHD